MCYCGGIGYWFTGGTGLSQDAKRHTPSPWNARGPRGISPKTLQDLNYLDQFIMSSWFLVPDS